MRQNMGYGPSQKYTRALPLAKKAKASISSCFKTFGQINAKRVQREMKGGAKVAK